MSIVLTRVDFRLIHGQVITRWLTQCQINEIVTVDTALSKDEFMQDVFKMAAPKGVKIKILDIDTAVKQQQSCTDAVQERERAERCMQGRSEAGRGADRRPWRRPGQKSGEQRDHAGSRGRGYAA